MKKLSKTEAEKQINEFFLNIKNKTPKQIKKIKRLAMSHNVKLGEHRKMFCKKCFHPYKEPSIRIKNDKISIICDNCNYASRWKIKN